jgi:hypothetical protein
MSAADLFSDPAVDAALAQGAIKLVELIVEAVRSAGSDHAAVLASLEDAGTLLSTARADAMAARAEGQRKLDEEPK